MLSEAIEEGTRVFLCRFRTCKQPILYDSHSCNGAQGIWYNALVSLSPNRAAKSLEILNVIAVQAVTSLMAGPCSQ